MQETKVHNTYKLPDGFIPALKNLLLDFIKQTEQEEKKKINRYDVNLMYVNQIVKNLIQYTEGKPTIIKTSNNKFFVLGNTGNKQWQFTDVSKHQETLNIFFENLSMTTINNGLIVPIKAKKIPQAIFELIILSNAHIPEYKTPNQVYCFFGATDFKTRTQQIYFIQGILADFSSQLLENIDFPTKEAYKKHIQALCALLCLVFFTKKCIGELYWARSSKASTLVRLLDNAMQLDNKYNPMDNQTKALIFKKTMKLLNNGELKYTVELAKKVSPSNWKDFTNFVSYEYEQINEKPCSNFPATKLFMQVFSIPLELVGYTTGEVLGKGISQSTKLLNSKLHLISLLGNGMIWMFGNGVVPGVILFAQPMAEEFLSTYCKTSLGYILGKSFKILGKGIGGSLGFSLDISYKLIRESIKQVKNLMQQTSKKSPISGLSLIDGTRYINGFVEAEQENTEIYQEIYQNETQYNPTAPPMKLVIHEQEGLILHMGQEQMPTPWDKIDPRLKNYLEKKIMSTNEVENNEQLQYGLSNENMYTQGTNTYTPTYSYY